MRAKHLWLFALCASLVSLSVSLVGSAANRRDYSKTELRIIEDEISEQGYILSKDPVGKTIEWVQVVPLDVFDYRDPFPEFLNVFHTTTQSFVIRNEFLVENGDVFDWETAEEAARTLRARRMLSIVLAIPVEGSTPDRVGLIIITKDTWSLRLNWDLVLDGSTIRRLVIQPSEENIAGTHIGANLLFSLDLATFTLGGGVSYPRLAGTWLTAQANVGFVFNRDRQNLEGTLGGFVYGLPLYSRTSKWSWLAGLAWKDDITRIFEGVDIRLYNPPSEPEVGIPYQYRSDIEAGGFEVTRSHGYFTKFDLTVGVEARRQFFLAPDLAAQGFSPIAIAEFKEAVLPTNDTRVSPFIQTRLYSSRFFHTHNFNTLELQEDYRLGPDVLVRLYPASKDFVSTRSMLGVYTALGYTIALGADGLARANASSTIEIAEPGKNDGRITGALRIVTPRVAFLRVVFDGFVIDNYINYFNRQITLGGDSRPRGYQPGQFIGEDAVVGSLELRTSGIHILSASAGAALFYDMGDAFDGFENMRPAKSVGVGFRVLFPQANRIVLRGDWGFPIATQGFSSWPGRFFVTFGQAFGMPGVTEPSAVAGL